MSQASRTAPAEAPSAAAPPQEVAPGLFRIRLTSPSGLTVNAWLVRTDDGAVLVDAGFTYTVAALEAQLAMLDLRWEDLAAVVYTHTHEDHMGGGVVLDARLRGQHVIAEGTVPAQGNYYDYYDGLESWDGWLQRVLPATPLRDRILEARARRHRLPWRQGGDGTLTSPVWVPVGGAWSFGGLRFERLEAQGHDPWHVAWFVPERGWLFTGDVLLGLPTPLMEPLQDDLTSYRATLQRLARFSGASLVLPGHGRAWDDLPQAVASSWEHVVRVHRALVEAFAAAALEPGPGVDVGTVAAGLLPPDRLDMRQAFVWLSNVHAQLAEWARMGLVVQHDDGYWAALTDLPPEPALLPVSDDAAALQIG